MTVIASYIYRLGERNEKLPLTATRSKRPTANLPGSALPTRQPMKSACLKSMFDLHPLAVEDALNGKQVPKVEVYGDQLFVIIKTAHLEGDKIAYGETSALRQAQLQSCSCLSGTTHSWRHQDQLAFRRWFHRTRCGGLHTCRCYGRSGWTDLAIFGERERASRIGLCPGARWPRLWTAYNNERRAPTRYGGTAGQYPRLYAPLVKRT